MKVGGQILWNVTPICETSQIHYLKGRRPMKDVLGNHLKDRLFHLVHLLSITTSMRRTSQESTISVRKFYLDCSLDTHCTRGEFGRVTYWSQTLRSWRRCTHIGNLLEKTQCERGDLFKRKRRIYFSNQMDESKPLEEIRTWEHPPWHSINQFKERVMWTFLENQKGLRHHHTCQWSNKWFFDHVRKLHFPSSRWTQSQILLTERGITPYSTEIHWRIQTHTNLDVKQERRIDDCWNIDGSRDLSDLFLWTDSTQFTLLEEKPRDGYVWSGWRLTRKQLTSKPDNLWSEIWKTMGKKSKLKEKQKWSNEKLHVENAQKLRGICFIDREAKEFKETIKNARQKLETLVRQPKIQLSSVEETLQRIMGQTNKDCRFGISTLTSSLHQQHLLAGR